MKERRAVAPAERHRADLQPRHAIGPKGVAVERRVVARPGKRRHHIGEWAERAAPEVEHAAGKAFRRKSPTRGFQQQQPGSKGRGERPAASLDPLDAFGYRRAGLDDASHHQPDWLLCFNAFSSREPGSTSLENALDMASSRPRASSSSRTRRFGTLP